MLLQLLKRLFLLLVAKPWNLLQFLTIHMLKILLLLYLILTRLILLDILDTFVYMLVYFVRKIYLILLLYSPYLSISPLKLYFYNYFMFETTKYMHVEQDAKTINTNKNDAIIFVNTVRLSILFFTFISTCFSFFSFFMFYHSLRLFIQFLL